MEESGIETTPPVSPSPPVAAASSASPSLGPGNKVRAGGSFRRPRPDWVDLTVSLFFRCVQAYNRSRASP